MRSIIEKTDGTSLGLMTPTTSTTDRFSRTWDGKKQYSGIGTYMVDDGNYQHRFDRLKFGYRYNSTTRVSDDVFATGPALVSPTIVVGARGYSAGFPHQHANLANEAALADIIKSEMGIGNDTEKRAIGWAVRNQMIRMNTGSVADARDHFGDAHGQTATSAELTLAELILELNMSSDITGGAIKWFSPRSMPKRGESCRGYDCGGGLITVRDDAGVNQEVYAPTWHNSMRYVPVRETREWYVRFYAL